MASAAASLLTRITRCPIAARCLSGEHLACSRIVQSQAAATPGDFQVPEPWSGHISSASILFVSSNPSIDCAEAYPAQDWDDLKRVSFFAGRFDRGPVPWIDHRMRPLLATSPPRRRDSGVRFWFAARARASELLGRAAEPGRDFALTEVVHCKSREEIGVGEAFFRCVETWLRPVIRVAAARVIVLFGAYARTAFHDTYRIPPGTPMTGPRDLEGSDRIVVQLPHPNARDLHRNCYPLTTDQLQKVRLHLRMPGTQRDPSPVPPVPPSRPRVTVVQDTPERRAMLAPRGTGAISRAYVATLRPGHVIDLDDMVAWCLRAGWQTAADDRRHALYSALFRLCYPGGGVKRDPDGQYYATGTAGGQ